MSTSEIISILGILIAVSAIMFNNKLALDREKRKEFRNRLESVLKYVEDIENLAISFHTSDIFNENIADEIRWRLDRLSISLQSIRYFKVQKVSEGFIYFKKSITLRNFGSSTFSRKASSSEVIRDIHSYATDLTKTMIKIYDDRHKI